MNADQRKDYYSKETARRTPFPWEQPIDSFECRTCGKTVEIYDRFDKRTVYCSRACEKKFWRDATKHKNRNGNIDLSGGMSLQSLIRRERRSLD